MSDVEKKAKEAEDTAAAEAEKKAKEAERQRERRAKEKADKEAAEKAGFYVAPGKAVTCKKGMLSGAAKGREVHEGDRVQPEYFGEDGKAALAALVDKKVVVEVK